jgi:hypothetical protein
VTVCRGKGQKDRRVMLPEAVREDLSEHLGTRLPRICSKPATTFEQCRSYWVMRTSAPR